MTKEAARFAARLAKNLGLSVELVDERLTSWEARQARSVGGGSLRRGRPFDDAAAALILRDFLHNLQQNRDPASQVPAGEAC